MMRKYWQQIQTFYMDMLFAPCLTIRSIYEHIILTIHVIYNMGVEKNELIHLEKNK